MGRRVLTLAALWIVLSLAALGVGWVLLALLGASTDDRPVDQVFFAGWLGIFALAWASAAVVNIAALRVAMPWLGVAIAVATMIGLMRARAVLRGVPPVAWIAFIAIAVLLAERSIAVGPLEDTGGYHWSIVQWYEDYGVPVGLGLFQWRLATHSAWLALTALLDAGALEGRVATVANGAIFLASLWFAAMCAARWIRGEATFADRFALAAFAFLLQLIAKWDMRLSPSPDIPVLLIAIVVCWRMLADAERARPRDSVVALALIGAVATTIKLSALPIAVVCASTLWLNREVALRTRALATIGVAVVFVPLVAASWTSTGCVLFPISFGCIDAPTAVGPEAARQYGDIIHRTARHDIAAGWIATLLAAGYLAWRRRALNFRALIGPLAIAVLGIAFTALVAPTMRFAAGYLAIVPALAVAQAADEPLGSRVAPRALRALRSSLVALVALAIVVPLYKEFVYASLRARHFESWAERKRGDPAINAANSQWWLLPNRIDYRGPYEPARAIDFDYVVSPQMTCWNHAQPCASNPTLSALPKIRLRDPVRGLAGGFEKAR